MNKKYYLGKTYDRLNFLVYAVTALTGFLFFFIYHYLFPDWDLFQIACTVLLLIIILVVVEYKIFDYGKKNIYYMITPKALVLHALMGKVIEYPWSNFTEVYMAKMAPYDFCRVRFTYLGKELSLVKYIGNPNGICLKIFEKIREHVEIDPEIVRVTKALSD